MTHNEDQIEGLKKHQAAYEKSLDEFIKLLNELIKENKQATREARIINFGMNLILAGWILFGVITICVEIFGWY